MSSKQLLIVNQNEDILSLFNEYFHSQGLKCTLVDTGKKCLDELLTLITQDKLLTLITLNVPHLAHWFEG